MSNIFDKFSLKDRTAIVTGGAGLLGKEFCHTLAQAGALVVVADLNETAAQQVAESLEPRGAARLRGRRRCDPSRIGARDGLRGAGLNRAGGRAGQQRSDGPEVRQQPAGPAQQ